MNSSGSRFIILLLLVLQGFAPLVHAHVHISNTISGVIHINGLSVGNVDRDIATIESVGRQHVAIEMSTAIQKNQSLDDRFDLHEFYIDTASCWYLPLSRHSLPGSSFATTIDSSRFLFSSHPRAPPL